MKKIIISTLAALSLTASAISIASVSHDETAYLFGTQETVEIQVISTAEMATTEGQLFGTTFEALGGYIDTTLAIVVPIVGPILAPAKQHLAAAYQAVKSAALITIATRFSSLLNTL